MSVKFSVGRKGVSADHPLAVKVGIEVLERGGNAFDAAIAVSAVLSVVQPQMGGPGGDGFMIAFSGNDLIAYASSGRAPKGFDAERYLREKPYRGPLTVTVPGLVYLWGYIHDEYATLSMEDLLRPAISLAYNGFYAGWFLSRSSRLYESELDAYEWRKYFKGVREGDLIVNKDMARTLRIIASRGWDEFYYGSLAEEIVLQLQNQGVNIDLDDLMDHEGFSIKPLKLDINERVLYELPPNTQGISTLQLISALYELELYKYEFKDPERIYAWSKPVEEVYRFRDLNIGDIDYMRINVENHVRYSTIPKKYEIRSSTNLRDGDTTFFIVSDGESLIGFIQSLFYPFGSGLIAGGFPVQNRGYGFSKEKGLPNSPAPRKRPLHTLSILAVEDNKMKYVIGCTGGDYRPQIHLRLYENLFIYNMNLVEALAAPRFIYTQPLDIQKIIEIEEPLEAPRSEFIKVSRVGYHKGTGHAHIGVMSERGIIKLASDPRTEGISISS
ncbi:MAG: gamma-glutamyltransferase [Sulfolobales archaeon]